MEGHCTRTRGRLEGPPGYKTLTPKLCSFPWFSSTSTHCYGSDTFYCHPRLTPSSAASWAWLRSSTNHPFLLPSVCRVSSEPADRPDSTYLGLCPAAFSAASSRARAPPLDESVQSRMSPYTMAKGEALNSIQCSHAPTLLKTHRSSSSYAVTSFITTITTAFPTNRYPCAWCLPRRRVSPTDLLC